MTLKSNSKQLWLQSSHEYSLKKPELIDSPLKRLNLYVPWCHCYLSSLHVYVNFSHQMLIYSFSLFSYSEMLGLWPAAPQEAWLSGEEGEKPEGREGKKGRKAGRRGRGSKMIVNMGGGRVGVYFKNKRKGGREGGEAEWQWIWEGASECVLLK